MPRFILDVPEEVLTILRQRLLIEDDFYDSLSVRQISDLTLMEEVITQVHPNIKINKIT